MIIDKTVVMTTVQSLFIAVSFGIYQGYEAGCFMFAFVFSLLLEMRTGK